ncbi:hypothetical protein DSO57_1032134 [Entomophthora muscae]|uniref:Uncharacterized protein n=1 Tax=Entomophthora muscae TaxID=34485 RepID=A0ACC2S2C1_9FUNG|nr:hypothetical protein DSO57_1032134 [Entomophthora muscae]
MHELSTDKHPYIWHKQPFRLGIATHPLSCLRGKTVFADCIDDEWAVVYLLHNISVRFGDQIVISCIDSDGQFLLIEAAEHLPQWIRPEIMLNRVFLVDGALHILKEGGSGKLTIRDAISQLSKETLASEPIQKAALSRIKGYPEIARAQRQLTKCLVPRKVAHLLHHDPSLVSSATEAYYLRDPLGLKACRTMPHFPPKDLVSVTVQFTRTLYAQLAFQPVLSPLPPPFAALKELNINDPSVDLGIKLACGFELLMSNSKPRDDVSRDAKYCLLKTHMAGEGYFEGEMEGSARYQELENRLQKQYSLSRPQLDDPNSNITRILNEHPTFVTDADLAEHQTACDSLGWLDLTPETLQETLQAQKYTEPSEDLLGEEVGEDLRRLVENVSLFMTQDTGFEGAERLCDEIDLEESDDDIELDADAFMENLEDLLSSKPTPQASLDEYSAMMDAELQNTKVVAGQDDEDSDASLDMDLNLVRNLVASYQAQSQAGPTSSFMGPE